MGSFLHKKATTAPTVTAFVKLLSRASQKAPTE